MVGWRDDTIGKLVKEYKYDSVKALAGVLADLLDMTMPIIDGGVSVVPLPTITKHIRERGFDHTYLVAKKLARKRGWRVERKIARKKDSVQVGAGNTARIMQAAEAYTVFGEIDPEMTYMLFDDVWTTGASMKAALKKLQAAGASKIIIAVLAVSR